MKAEKVAGHAELTTEPPIFRPPIEASSLINRIDGPSVSTLKQFV